MSQFPNNTPHVSMNTPLSTTQQEQDKLFDEKFLPKTFDSYQGWTIQDFDEVTEYIRSRDLAIEKAVREEEKKAMYVEYKGEYYLQLPKETRVIYIMRGNEKVQIDLPLLTTSPSR